MADPIDDLQATYDEMAADEQIKRGMAWIEQSRTPAPWTQLTDGVAKAARAFASQAKRSIADVGALTLNALARSGAAQGGISPAAAEQRDIRPEALMPGETAPGGAFSPEARAHEESRPLAEQLLTGALAGAPTALLGPGAVAGDVDQALAETRRAGGGTGEQLFAAGASSLPLVGGKAAARVARRLFGGNTTAEALADLEAAIAREVDDAFPAPAPRAVRESEMGRALDWPSDAVVNSAEGGLPQRAALPTVPVPAPEPKLKASHSPEYISAMDRALADRLAKGDDPQKLLDSLDDDAIVDVLPLLSKRIGAKSAADATGYFAEKTGDAGGASPAGRFRGDDGVERYIKGSLNGSLTDLLDEKAQADLFRAFGRDALEYEIVEIPEGARHLLKNRDDMSLSTSARYALTSKILPETWQRVGEVAPHAVRVRTANSMLGDTVAALFTGNEDILNNPGNIMVNTLGRRTLMNDPGQPIVGKTVHSAQSVWYDLKYAIENKFSNIGHGDWGAGDMIKYALAKDTQKFNTIKSNLKDALSAAESAAGTASASGDALTARLLPRVAAAFSHYGEPVRKQIATLLKDNIEFTRKSVDSIAAMLLLLGAGGAVSTLGGSEEANGDI